MAPRPPLPLPRLPPLLPLPPPPPPLQLSLPHRSRRRHQRIQRSRRAIADAKRRRSRPWSITVTRRLEPTSTQRASVHDSTFRTSQIVSGCEARLFKNSSALARARSFIDCLLALFAASESGPTEGSGGTDLAGLGDCGRGGGAEESVERGLRIRRPPAGPSGCARANSNHFARS